MSSLLDLAWRDLRAGGRPLRVFAACLLLGVALIAAGGGLHRQVSTALAGELRAMVGGDVEIETHRPLDPAVRAWMDARGTVSRVVQLRTMLRVADGRSQLVELWSTDDRYPLVGTVRTEPPGPLAAGLAPRDGRHGVAVDAVTARRLGLAVGDPVTIGDAELTVRALLVHQSDRSWRADWRGAPVLVSAEALAATGLVQPLSRVEYRHRVLVEGSARAWRDAFLQAHPGLEAEVRTVDGRSDRLQAVVGQVGSGLLLVGVSTLFIGGLGVFNSVQAWLQGRLGALATLRALGLRDRRLTALVLLQVGLLGLAASGAGAVLGTGLALAGVAAVAATQGPIPLSWPALAATSSAAIGLGLLAALAFALPAVGRAVAVSPASLFRGTVAVPAAVPRGTWLATAVLAAGLLAALAAVLPDPRLLVAFVAVVVAVLLALEAVVRVVRAAAGRWLDSPGGGPASVELRLALTALQRPDSPLRMALLSLGAALTLLVACAMVVAGLLRLIDQTVPREAPALLFHDVQTDQLPALQAAAAASPGLAAVRTAPLVIGRLVSVNGRPLADDPDPGRRAAATEQHELSHRGGQIDDVRLVDGAWWPDGPLPMPHVAIEDTEAADLGLAVGDRLVFDIQGTEVEAELAAVFTQRRLQTRLWLEALFSDGALDPFVTRHVGAAWLPDDAAIDLQDRLARDLPHVVSVRTAAMLDAARSLLGRATAGLAVVGAVCLLASALVLAGVVAAGQARRAHEASVMLALGVRVSRLRRVLALEFALLGLATALFAGIAGGAIAAGVLAGPLDLAVGGVWGVGWATAGLVAAASLGAGGWVAVSRLRASPARLLRQAA